MVAEIFFSFLTAYPPVLAVAIFSFIIIVVINIFYKILINQNDAKQIKQRTKELSKQMKEQQKAGNMEKANELLNEMLKENNKTMKLTMKPMIISLIIVALLLPWASGHYGDRHAVLQNDTGFVELNGINHTVSLQNNALVIEGGSEYKTLPGAAGSQCDGTCFMINDGRYEVSMDKNNVKFTPIIAILPLPMPLPFIGYDLGWLGWYIFCSIPFVMLVRKMMKIYL